jgi:rod shape-determining protein MreC
MAPFDRERRWRGLDEGSRPSRSTLVALVLAAATLMTLDQSTGEDSPVEHLRAGVGEVLSPVETATAAVVRPFTAVPTWFRDKDDLRRDLRELEAENAALREQVLTADYDRNRLAEFDGLTTAAAELGRSLVPARVVGYGAAQSFSRTVTLDAGADAGLRPDMTVVNNDGLVGRVIRVTRSSATVLLLVDAESVVGGRVGSSRELGFLRGREDGTLDLELVDQRVVPAQGDTVVTWGSEGAGPYVARVPVGRVTDVFASVREQSQRAVIEPFVDFTALDVVGVVVPEGTASDRAVVGADGGIG